MAVPDGKSGTRRFAGAFIDDRNTPDAEAFSGAMVARKTGRRVIDRIDQACDLLEGVDDPKESYMQEAVLQAVFATAAELSSLAGRVQRRMKRGEELSADEILAVAARFRSYATTLEEAVKRTSRPKAGTTTRATESA